MADRPEGRITHLTSRRLRVKIPDKRRDAAFFDTVARRLADWASIERVEVNPMTASVLVHFSDAATLFAENLAKNDLFAIAAENPADIKVPSVMHWARQSLSEVDAAMRRWSAGGADIRNVMFVMLAGSAVVQLARGNIAAPATTLLWYAGAMLRAWDTGPEVKEAVREG